MTILTRTSVETAIAPTFGIRSSGNTADPGIGPFVVAMIDLDAPTPQNTTYAELRHFLGGDLILKDCDDRTTSGVASLSNMSVAITDYVQPAPPAGSDPHRHVALLVPYSRVVTYILPIYRAADMSSCCTRSPMDLIIKPT